jgi:hypothetical protein
MKTMKIILLFAAMIVAGSVWANEKEKADSIFFWYNKDQSFEPYEPVLLKGTYNVQMVKEIKLNYQLNNLPHTVDVAMANGNWSASVGSFLPHQSIVLNFDVQVQADLGKIIELRNLFVGKFSVVLDSLLKFQEDEDRETHVLQEKIIKGINERLSEGFDSFKDEDGKSLRECLTKGLNNDDNIKNLSTYNNAIKRCNKSIDFNLEQISDSLSKFDGQIKPSVNDYITFFQQNDSTNKPTLDTTKFSTPDVKKNIKRIEENWNDLVKGKINLKNVVDSLIPSTEILVTKSFQFSLKNNQELKFALKNFIGFDVMPVYFSARELNSTFGLFFTASPYFGKTDPDEKIFQKEDSCGNFRRCVTPTLGFGLTTSPKTNQVLPLVYVGIGFRLNNIVRVSIGETLYTKKYTTPTDGTDPIIKVGNCLTLGIGISTDYLSDFLKVFSTTVNQFGK